MTNPKLASQLQRLVDRYGLDQVHREIQELRPSKGAPRPQKQRRLMQAAKTLPADKARKPKLTASEYVAKMDISPDRRSATSALAQRFEDKSFLPTCGDIRNFCQIYGIDVPASKARASAIPRVFKFVAAMEAADIQMLLDSNAFSGPARLGPIAEAIRSHGRAARHADGGIEAASHP